MLVTLRTYRGLRMTPTKKLPYKLKVMLHGTIRNDDF